MSYTISISGLEIDCNYTSNYHLLDESNFKYFVQIITDQSLTYNYYGTGIPSIDTTDLSVSKSLFILTVFSDNINTILMPTIYLNDVNPYLGLTLKAFVNDNTNKIKISNISKTNDNIFIYNVDSSNNIVSKIGDMGTSVYMLMQPVGKNLCIDIDGNSQYSDPTINTQISVLIINTQLYNGILKKTMPNYVVTPSSNSTQNKTLTIVFYIFVLLVVIFAIAVLIHLVIKRFRT